MHLWRNAFLVKMTLFFFAAMLFFNPVYAQQRVSASAGLAAPLDQNDFPVVYVSEEEARQLAWEFQDKGYVVREGTLAQLEALAVETNQGAQENNDPKEEGSKKECGKEKSESDEQGVDQAVEDSKVKDAASSEKALDAEKAKDEDCELKKAIEETGQQQVQEMDDDLTPVPEPEFPAEYYPQPEVHAHVGVQANLSYNGGGNNRDFAKVFFIVAGVVVIAAFVVYAGKYIVDLARGEDKKLWREISINSTFLSTEAGRHGQFVGAKLATGFVSDELIQLALVGELGDSDLNLLLNEYTDPTPLDMSATYWMLGATARLHLTDALVNASYLYLELMGGTTNHSATGVIGAARLGASFGLNDYLRLGASLGAQYIGLDEDQGFANDGENYWLTYGVEIGARF